MSKDIIRLNPKLPDFNRLETGLLNAVRVTETLTASDSFKNAFKQMEAMNRALTHYVTRHQTEINQVINATEKALNNINNPAIIEAFNRINSIDLSHLSNTFSTMDTIKNVHFHVPKSNQVSSNLVAAPVRNADLVIVPSNPVIYPTLDYNLQKPSAENKSAYEYITSLEMTLRLFIIETMTSFYGLNWLEQIPSDVYEKLKESQAKDTAQNQTNNHLFEYADFSHYSKIIICKNNWDNVFKVYFGRKESVAESLLQLNCIRIAVMHSRTISQTDCFAAYVEADRILRAITTFS